ncbi:MAG: hypothetical protein AABX90_01835, partial [Nanoarchaeota archaeon]
NYYAEILGGVTISTKITGDLTWHSTPETNGRRTGGTIKTEIEPYVISAVFNPFTDWESTKEKAFSASNTEDIDVNKFGCIRAFHRSKTTLDGKDIDLRGLYFRIKLNDLAFNELCSLDWSSEGKLFEVIKNRREGYNLICEGSLIDRFTVILRLISYELSCENEDIDNDFVRIRIDVDENAMMKPNLGQYLAS